MLGVVEWLSNDPIGISGGLNQYVFCLDNPVNYVDPLGLCKCECGSSGSGSGWWSTILSGIGGGIETLKNVVVTSPARNPGTGLPMAGTEVSTPFLSAGNIASKLATPLAIFTTGLEINDILSGTGSAGNKALNISSTVLVNTVTFGLGAGAVGLGAATGPGLVLGAGGAVAIGVFGEWIKGEFHQYINECLP